MTTDYLSESGLLTCEPGGWITCRVAQREMEADPNALLSKSVERRPGNLRFVIAGGRPYLLGELRGADGQVSLLEARQRLLAADDGPVEAVCPEEAACVLGATAYEWTQPQEITGCWQATANDPRGHRCDLTATIIQGGVEVCGRLTTWDTDLPPRSRAALARFLVAAQARVRFARFTLNDREANVVSFSTAQRLDAELPDSVAAVVAACRLVWREVRALASDAVAQAYLEAAY